MPSSPLILHEYRHISSLRSMWVIGCGTCLKSTAVPLGLFVLLVYLICKLTTLSSLQRASLPLSPAYNVRSRGTEPRNNHLSFLYCKTEESWFPMLSFFSYFYLQFMIVERYTFVHPVCIIGWNFLWVDISPLLTHLFFLHPVLSCRCLVMPFLLILDPCYLNIQLKFIWTKVTCGKWRKRSN